MQYLSNSRRELSNSRSHNYMDELDHLRQLCDKPNGAIDGTEEDTASVWNGAVPQVLHHQAAMAEHIHHVPNVNLTHLERVHDHES